LKPKFCTQEELNDLIQDLGLTKDRAELLGSRLQERSMLHKNVKVTFYQKQ